MTTRRGMAHGEPWSIMYTNVANRLERCKGLHPLELTLEQIAAPCLPSDLRSTKSTVTWRNLLSSLNVHMVVKFNVNDIIFWVTNETKELWPTPVSRDLGFVVTAEHPHWNELVIWTTAAGELNEKLETAKMYLNRTLNMLKHPKWVEQYWPEIVPYVGSLPEAMVKAYREPRPASLRLDHPLQEEIVDMLTMASLLPKNYEVNAWVGSRP